MAMITCDRSLLRGNRLRNGGGCLRGLLLGIVVLGAVEGFTARGDVIFSNLGPNDTYNQVLAYALQDSDLAMPFTVTAGSDMVLKAAEVALFYSLPFRTPGEGLNVVLMTDNAGLPGSVVETMPYGLAIDQPMRSLIQVQSSLQPVLLAGAIYWLGIVTNRTVPIGWFTSLNGQSGHLAARKNGPWYLSAPTNLDTAFRLTGMGVVPEPAALLSGSVGLILLAFRAGRATGKTHRP